MKKTPKSKRRVRDVEEKGKRNDMKKISNLLTRSFLHHGRTELKESKVRVKIKKTKRQICLTVKTSMQKYGSVFKKVFKKISCKRKLI